MGRFLAFLALLALALASPALAVLPQAPANFLTRVPNPLVAWSFRQDECAAGNTVVEDVTGNSILTLTRSGSSTTCTTSNSSGASFAFSRNGARLTAVSDTDALRTTTGIGSSTALANLTIDGGVGVLKDVTYEAWFTLTQNLTTTATYTLFDISSPNTASGVQDVSQSQFYIVYAPGAPSKLEFGAQGTDSSGGPAQLPAFITSSTYAPIADIRNGGGSTWYLCMTANARTSSQAGKTEVIFSFGRLGGTLNVANITRLFFDVRTYALDPSSVVRIGTTRGTGGSYLGLPADFHWTALYGQLLSPAQVAQNFAAGVPNSKPSVDRSPLYIWTLTQDQPNPLIDLTATGSYFDVDNSPSSSFSFLLYRPSQGKFTLNGTDITAAVTVVRANDVIRFFPATTFPNPASFSTPFATAGCSSTYATFTYRANDGVCDGYTSLTSSSCFSTTNGTGVICIKEINHAPVIPSYDTNSTLLANNLKPQKVLLRCRDDDVSTASLGLTTIRILSQSNPTLGTLVNQTSPTTCGSFSLNVTSSPYNISVGASPVGNGAVFEAQLCYRSNPTTSSAPIVGQDVISYQCVDAQGAVSSTGTFRVTVRNALLAGCGTTETADDTPCTMTGAEDTNFTLTLRGYDAVASHINQNRSWRVETKPLYGTLVDPANPTATVDVGYVLKANLTTGLGYLTYIPQPDYFNAFCENADPELKPGSTTNEVQCPATVTLYRQNDLLGVPIRGCANAAGCPDSFAYSQGYAEDGVNYVFGPATTNGMRVTVINTWDPPSLTAVSGPVNVTKIPLNEWVTFNGNNGTSSYSFTTVDGDIRRIAFYLNVVVRRASISVLGLDANVGIGSRLAFSSGTTCLETGCSDQSIAGKGLPSDINQMLRALRLRTTQRTGNDTLQFSVYDPAPYAANTGLNFNSTVDYRTFARVCDTCSSAFIIDDLVRDGYNRDTTTLLTFGSGSSSSGADSTIGVALIAGLSAAGFIVLLSIAFCLICVANRARQGERAAMWIMRNVLFSDVNDPNKKPEIASRAKDARRSLERAVRAEHERLQEIVWCAVCLRRVCPCIVRFGGDNIDLPDEENLMREAMYQEEDAIAQKHKPKDNPPPVDTKKSMEDVQALDVEDDQIWDWEKHIDEKTGKPFYYNAKTGKSQWTPPTVRVHTDRISVKDPAVFTPKPPSEPRPKDDTEQEDRVKRA